jgi:hypothetical protein
MKTSTVPPPAERRSAPRYAANPETSCHVSEAEHQAFQLASIKNISTSGIRVALKRRYEVGTPLIAELMSKNGHLQRLLTVRVVHLAEQVDGSYVLGCAFLSPLEGHELLTLVL